jgi:hypothetical protein
MGRVWGAGETLPPSATATTGRLASGRLAVPPAPAIRRDFAGGKTGLLPRVGAGRERKLAPPPARGGWEGGECGLYVSPVLIVDREPLERWRADSPRRHGVHRGFFRFSVSSVPLWLDSASNFVTNTLKGDYLMVE